MSSRNIFGSTNDRDNEHYNVRRSSRVASMTPTKVPNVVIPSSSIRGSPRHQSPSTRRTANRSNYVDDKLHPKYLVESSTLRTTEERSKEFWLTGQETPTRGRRSTIFDETPGLLLKDKDINTVEKRRRSRSRNEQNVSWAARWWFVTVPILLILAIVKFIFLSVWQLGLPVLKGIFRALKTAMKQSTASIDHVMTPNKRKKQESSWNIVLYVIVFVVATMLALAIGRMAIRVHLWWSPESHPENKKALMTRIAEEHASLKSFAENLNEILEDRFKRAERTLEVFKSNIAKVDNQVNTQIPNLEKSTSMLKTLFEDHMIKGSVPKNFTDQIKNEVQKIAKTFTLGMVQEDKLVLEPLFEEYLENAQIHQLNVVEAKIESALQDRRLQNLVNASPNDRYDGPPMLPNYALIGLGARILENLTSPIYMQCTNLMCKLQRIFTTRHFDGLPPQVALKSNLEPALCWSFTGHEGKITILLGTPITVTSISIGHVPAYAVNDRSSAPRTFDIYALNEKRNDMDAKLLGSGTYALDGPTYQTFSLKPTLARILQLRIKSNHGNEKYTCLYRILIHGDESKLLESKDNES